MEDTNELQRRT